MAKTALLFGEVDEEGCPTSALAHFGQDAYEHYMVAPYARELLMVRNSEYVCWSPHFDSLYAAMLALGHVQFEELGSTMFSTIDKIDKLRIIHEALPQPIVDYVGIEISRLLIDLAEALHEKQKPRHFASWQSVPATSTGIVSRSYQSTSYAFRNTRDLFDWVSRSKFGIHGLWWSLDGKEIETTMVGNRLALFDPDMFNRMALEAGFDVKVVKSEVFSHDGIRFSASWIALQRMTAPELAKMRYFCNEMRLNPIVSICDLSAAALAKQPYAGDHANFFPVKSNTPFDFQGSALMTKFRSSQ
jgi:hypothetical protein